MLSACATPLSVRGTMKAPSAQHPTRAKSANASGCLALYPGNCYPRTKIYAGAQLCIAAQRISQLDLPGRVAFSSNNFGLPTITQAQNARDVAT